MNNKKKVLVSWSGGKDSALALQEIIRDGSYEIAALLTTITTEYDRISMHGIRRSLLEQQAHDECGDPPISLVARLTLPALRATAGFVQFVLAKTYQLSPSSISPTSSNDPD